MTEVEQVLYKYTFAEKSSCCFPFTRGCVKGTKHIKKNVKYRAIDSLGIEREAITFEKGNLFSKSRFTLTSPKPTIATILTFTIVEGSFIRIILTNKQSSESFVILFVNDRSLNSHIITHYIAFYNDFKCEVKANCNQVTPLYILKKKQNHVFSLPPIQNELLEMVKQLKQVFIKGSGNVTIYSSTRYQKMSQNSIFDLDREDKNAFARLLFAVDLLNSDFKFSLPLLAAELFVCDGITPEKYTRMRYSIHGLLRNNLPIEPIFTWSEEREELILETEELEKFYVPGYPRRIGINIYAPEIDLDTIQYMNAEEQSEENQSFVFAYCVKQIARKLASEDNNESLELLLDMTKEFPDQLEYLKQIFSPIDNVNLELDILLMLKEYMGISLFDFMIFIAKKKHCLAVRVYVGLLGIQYVELLDFNEQCILHKTKNTVYEIIVDGLQNARGEELTEFQYYASSIVSSLLLKESPKLSEAARFIQTLTQYCQGNNSTEFDKQTLLAIATYFQRNILEDVVQLNNPDLNESIQQEILSSSPSKDDEQKLLAVIGRMKLRRRTVDINQFESIINQLHQPALIMYMLDQRVLCFQELEVVRDHISERELVYLIESSCIELRSPTEIAAEINTVITLPQNNINRVFLKYSSLKLFEIQGRRLYSLALRELIDYFGHDNSSTIYDLGLASREIWSFQEYSIFSVYLKEKQLTQIMDGWSLSCSLQFYLPFLNIEKDPPSVVLEENEQRYLVDFLRVILKLGGLGASWESCISLFKLGIWAQNEELWKRIIVLEIRLIGIGSKKDAIDSIDLMFQNLIQWSTNCPGCIEREIKNFNNEMIDYCQQYNYFLPPQSLPAKKSEIANTIAILELIGENIPVAHVKSARSVGKRAIPDSAREGEMEPQDSPSPKKQRIS